MGRIEEIWIYPVTSLRGTTVPAAEIGPAGLVGDRAWTVVDDDGRPVRSRDAAGLASLAPEDVTPAALAEALGRPAHLEQLPPRPGVAPVHLVSRQAVERAARGDVPEGCSAGDPRANLLIALDADADADADERSWVGRELAIGQAVLRITRTPKHCLGVYADVVSPGAAHAGDAVSLIGNPAASH